jgi:hypothetical protein
LARRASAIGLSRSLPSVPSRRGAEANKVANAACTASTTPTWATNRRDPVRLLGVIPRHVEAGAPYCLWYAHWQGLNPVKGVGWQAFRTVVERIRKHLDGRVVWLRPSEITNRYQQAGGWGFLDNV